jgi:mannosyltransferase
MSRVEDLSLRMVAAAAMSLAAVSTLVTLGRQPLSWDEAVTLGAAERSPGELFRMLGHTDAPLGLYYFLMQGWLSIGDALGVGAAAWWLRLPSALAAIAAVGVLVGLVSRWFGLTAALVAGVLLAVHPMMTFYAQDARPYALVTLAFLLATLALLRAVDSPTWQRLSLYGIVAVGCLYLHLFVGYAFGAHLVLVLRARGARRSAPTLWRWAVVAGGVVIAVSPLLMASRRETGEVSWIGHPTIGLVQAVLTRLFGGGWLVLALVAIAMVAVVTSRHGPGRPVAFLTIWLGLPVLALVLVDFIVPDLVARYGLVCVPAVAALVGRAVARPGRGLAILAPLTAAAVVVAAGTTWRQESQPFKYEDYRAAADVMGDLARPGDAVMFFPMSMRAGFDAYRSIEPDLSNIRDAALAPGGSPVRTDQIGGEDAPATAMAARFGGAAQIFVLGNPLAQVEGRPLSATDRAQLDVLTHYRVVRTTRWGVVSLTELQRLAPTVVADRSHNPDSAGSGRTG